MAIGVAESRRDGTNPRTSSKNELAWREFKAYAKIRGFEFRKTSVTLPSISAAKVDFFWLFDLK